MREKRKVFLEENRWTPKVTWNWKWWWRSWRCCCWNWNV